jgi:hypothetical protein
VNHRVVAVIVLGCSIARPEAVPIASPPLAARSAPPVGAAITQMLPAVAPPRPASKPVDRRPRAVPVEVAPQIKHARGVPVRATPVVYKLGAALSIDGRDIALSGRARFDRIARSVARLPGELRALIHSITVSAVANPYDAAFSKKYGFTVVAAMSAGAPGDITIFPLGIAELRDEDVFVRNLLHELGHTWSRRAWSADPPARQRWIEAIARDASPPSRYASSSFRGSGDPDEDVAEATALYFLVHGTPLYARYQAAMPARFALLLARFGGGPDRAVPARSSNA